MPNLELNRKYFACEVCGKRTINPKTMGIELDKDAVSPIQLCHHCGPIDVDVMQLCRETTIGCTDN
jgi:transcription elongation factor Elf1